MWRIIKHKHHHINKIAPNRGNIMNASQIITDDMSLEEKLAAIDSAMAQAVVKAQDDAAQNGTSYVPLDPADLTMCEGCQ